MCVGSRKYFSTQNATHPRGMCSKTKGFMGPTSHTAPQEESDWRNLTDTYYTEENLTLLAIA